MRARIHPPTHNGSTVLHDWELAPQGTPKGRNVLPSVAYFCAQRARYGGVEQDVIRLFNESFSERVAVSLALYPEQDTERCIEGNKGWNLEGSTPVMMEYEIPPRLTALMAVDVVRDALRYVKLCHFGSPNWSPTFCGLPLYDHAGNPLKTELIAYDTVSGPGSEEEEALDWCPICMIEAKKP